MAKNQGNKPILSIFKPNKEVRAVIYSCESCGRKFEEEVKYSKKIELKNYICSIHFTQLERELVFYEIPYDKKRKRHF
jgi:hypothetical protein